MGKKVAVVYATHSGNAELIAEAVSDGLSSNKKLTIECLRAEQTTARQLSKFDSIILICSTYDVGLLNDKMIRLNKEIREEGEKTFGGKNFEVIGLGDSEHYDIFCGAADILEQTVKSVGGKQYHETIHFDGPPHDKLKDFKKWGEDLSELISQ